MNDPAKPSSAPAHMKERARELRKNSTIPERILWGLLRDRRLAGVKFRRQHCVGPYIVDFYCLARRLVIEVDGRSNDDRADYDQARQAYLESVAGLHVIRVGNDDILGDPESVILSVLKALGIPIV
jgi:very-short-patch-repair endonuclease